MWICTNFAHYYKMHKNMNKMRNILTVLALMLTVVAMSAQDIVVGAARLDQYVSKLQGKRVALLSNHTGMVGD